VYKVKSTKFAKVVGYISPISSQNDGKKAETDKRVKPQV